MRTFGLLLNIDQFDMFVLIDKLYFKNLFPPLFVSYKNRLMSIANVSFLSFFFHFPPSMVSNYPFFPLWADKAICLIENWLSNKSKVLIVTYKRKCVMNIGWDGWHDYCSWHANVQESSFGLDIWTF